MYISGSGVGCLSLRHEKKCLLVFNSHTFCLVNQISGLLQISLDTYLIKQRENFHWERAGSQVEISLMWFLTCTGGICSYFRFMLMPFTFIYPSDKHKGLQRAKYWVRCTRVKWPKTHLEYSFESRCSTVKPPERDYMEKKFFLLSTFYFLKYFFYLPPFCFAVLAGLSLSSFPQQHREVSLKSAHVWEASAGWVPKELQPCWCPDP